MSPGNSRGLGHNPGEVVPGSRAQAPGLESEAGPGPGVQGGHLQKGLLSCVWEKQASVRG